MKVRLALVVLLFVTVVSGAYLAAQDAATRGGAAPQNESIRKQDLKADLFFLANDLTEGGWSGRRGMRWRPSSSNRGSSASA